jgi:twitching motility protein PilT
VTQPGEADASAVERPGADREFRLRAALEEMIRRRASDLHLKVGRAPVLRIDGELFETELTVLRPEDLRRSMEQLMSPGQRERFAETHELDFAVGVQGLGRFRVNVFQQRGTPGFALRAVPFDIPALDSLGLPEVAQQIAMAPRGLVLVTGITGSGKSTTLAAMLGHLNARKSVNVVTVEDPIEFLHRDNRAVISQREVGSDTLSFNDALRHVLRQDPDVIMLGEIRDRESMETVLKAADTGHLVMSTLHTTDAAQTIGRIISFFEPYQHDEVRALLASVLRAVVSLRLVPRADGMGRVPAVEVLVNTAAISDRIRSGEQIHTLPDLIADGHSQYGMQTFDQSLMELYRRQQISYQSALHFATNAAEFALRASGIEGSANAVWSGADLNVEREG